MYRVKVTINNEHHTKLEKFLIVKTMPILDSLKKENVDIKVFETEIKMYLEVIPKFQKLLKESGDNTVIGGKCLYGAIEPNPVIVFEDLTKDNYKPVSSWGGDWEITLKGVQKLAKWHAISYKLFTDGDKYLQTFSSNFFTDKIFEFPAFANGFEFFFDAIKDRPEFRDYLPKFEKYIANKPLEKVRDIFMAFFNGKKANLFTLNHADFHIKNFMIKENSEGKLEDVKLIDFQVCIWGPAAIDLIYLIYMSLDSKSRLERRDEIIYRYYCEFKSTLERLNFEGNIPKLTDIYEDFITFKDWGEFCKFIWNFIEIYICFNFLEIFLLCICLPFVIAFEKDGSLLSDDAFGNNDVMKSFYTNPKYLNYLQKVLPSIIHKGYLD